MTIAFLPWPTSIYVDQSQHAISIYMVRSPSEIQLCADTTTHLYDVSAPNPFGGSLTSTTKHDSVAGAIAKSFSGHLSRCGSYTIVSMGLGSSHLACGHELKRAERDLEVGGVGLEVVESSRDAGLELGGALARRARGRDLVEGAHGCGGCRWED